MLLLYAIPIGLLLGFMAGGRLAPLAGVRIRWWQLALGGLAFQLALFAPPLAALVGDLGPPLFVGSTLVVLAALIANLDQPGFRLILLGASLNLLVIVANGGQMPASPDALQAVFGTRGVPVEHFSNSIVGGPGSPFYFLGDLFHLPRPLPLANVFSVGDLLIGAGGAWFLAQTMRRPQPADGRQPLAGAARG